MHEIELKPSRRLGLLLAGFLLLALVAVQRAALPAGMQVALGLVAAGLVLWGWRRAGVPAVLRVGADGRLQCLDDAAEWRDIEVLGESFVSTRLIVLRYRLADGPPQTLTLLSDSGDADGLRRLRVSLRWARHTRSDTAYPDAG